VLRLVGKGRWRNEGSLRAAFGKAIQSRAEKDKLSTAKADKVRPPPRFPIAH